MSTPDEIPAAETDTLVRAARLHQQTGRLSQAEAIYRQVLQRHPENAETQNDLGKVLRAQGRLNDALRCFEKALEIKPDYSGAHINLGNALHQLGRIDEAISCYRKLLTLKPDNILAHINLGNLLHWQGIPDQAAACYRSAIAIKPDHFEAHHNLGTALQAQGDLRQALYHYQTAIAFKPDYAEAYNHCGMVLRLLGRLDEAKSCHERALALKPDYAESLCNLGIVFKEMDRIEEAISCYQRSISLNPRLAETYNNLANALLASGKLDEATQYYQTALTLRPDYVDAHWNLSTILLIKQDFSRGWPEHEWRWKTKDNKYLRRCFEQQWWDGRDPAGKTLLLWGEQGIGDEVLYAGLVHDVIAGGARVILECAPRLVPLFTRSFPEATIIARSNPPDPIAHSADLQSPTGNLGRWLRAGVDSFHRHDGYLIADADLTARLRDRYQALGGGKRVVGISWRSGNAKVGRFRSIALSEWAPMLTMENVTFVNLQYGDSSEQLSQVRQQLGVDVFQDTKIDSLQNLDAFAAQVAAMDLVISVDNSTVHFAGALGKPVWNLLPKAQGLAWYWFSEGETSLWYPSMRLFRQDLGGGWNTTMQRIARALHEFSGM